MIFYGSCRPLLLLAASHDSDFSDWELTDVELFFETGPRDDSEIPLAGPLIDGPTHLASGPWTVGLGVWESSDDLNQPDQLYVLCYLPFTVESGTQHVEIGAYFAQRCRIDVIKDGVPTPVPCTDETFYGLDDAGRDRIDTTTYPDEHLVTVSVTSLADPTYNETATLDYEDAACLSHRLIGPVMRGVVEGFEPVSAESADLVGRLMLPNAGVGCSMLIDAAGLTWDTTWLGGYDPTSAVSDDPGLVGPDGEVVAASGDLIGVNGREVRRGRGCGGGGAFRAREIVFVE